MLGKKPFPSFNHPLCGAEKFVRKNLNFPKNSWSAYLKSPHQGFTSNFFSCLLRLQRFTGVPGSVPGDMWQPNDGASWMANKTNEVRCASFITLHVCRSCQQFVTCSFRSLWSEGANVRIWEGVSRKCLLVWFDRVQWCKNLKNKSSH